jgi:hypothetical protein
LLPSFQGGSSGFEITKISAEGQVGGLIGGAMPLGRKKNG